MDRITFGRGGKKFEVSGSWQRDNLGFNENQGTAWNTDIADIAMGGAIPFTNKKLRFFVSANMFLSDDFYRIRANQLNSSLFPDDQSFWAPSLLNFRGVVRPMARPQPKRWIW